jgi:hypothetical protein
MAMYIPKSLTPALAERLVKLVTADVAETRKGDSLPELNDAMALFNIATTISESVKKEAAKTTA